MTDQSKKGQLHTHEPSNSVSQEDTGTAVQPKEKRSRVAGLALFLAIIALFLSIQEKLSSENASIKAINQMIANTVVPRMKSSNHNDIVRTIYDLKHMSVTLEQIKETSRNEEIKAMVDQLKKQIEDLSVKLFVHK